MPGQKASSSNLFEAKVRKTLAAIFCDHPDEDLTKVDIIRLAKQSRKLPPEWLDAIQEKALDREIGRILRSEKFVTEEGTKLRAYHCYKQFTQADGKEIQQVFWRSIETMTARQMTACLRARYALSKDIRNQANVTREYWNKNVAPRLGEKPLQKRLFED